MDLLQNTAFCKIQKDSASSSIPRELRAIVADFQAKPHLNRDCELTLNADAEKNNSDSVYIQHMISNAMERIGLQRRLNCYNITKKLLHQNMHLLIEQSGIFSLSEAFSDYREYASYPKTNDTKGARDTI